MLDGRSSNDVGAHSAKVPADESSSTERYVMDAFPIGSREIYVSEDLTIFALVARRCG